MFKSLKKCYKHCKWRNTFIEHLLYRIHKGCRYAYNFIKYRCSEILTDEFNFDVSPHLGYPISNQSNDDDHGYDNYHVWRW